ncbi:MAG: Hpt domain-containing protein [Pseudomonadota bacterium]
MSSEPVNAATVAELKDIVGDGIDEIIDAYVTDGRELIETMTEALSQSDCEKLRAASHQLKSSSANVGALVVSEMMKEIESHAKNGDVPSISSVFSSAANEFDRVVEYFAA